MKSVPAFWRGKFQLYGLLRFVYIVYSIYTLYCRSFSVFLGWWLVQGIWVGWKQAGNAAALASGEGVPFQFRICGNGWHMNHGSSWIYVQWCFIFHICIYIYIYMCEYTVYIVWLFKSEIVSGFKVELSVLLILLPTGHRETERGASVVLSGWCHSAQLSGDQKCPFRERRCRPGRSGMNTGPQYFWTFIAVVEIEDLI